MTRDTKSDNKNEYTLTALAELLGAELVLRNGLTDATDILISGIAPLSSAIASQLSFCASAKHHAELIATSAAAVIVSADAVDDCPVHCLVHKNPYLAFAQLSHSFDLRPKPALGIHPTAVIAPTASIAEGARIAPGVDRGYSAYGIDCRRGSYCTGCGGYGLCDDWLQCQHRSK